MKFYKPILSIGITAILLTSCADESPWDAPASDGKGTIRVMLTADNGISSKLPKVKSVATDIVAPDASEFQLRLTNVSGTYAKTWNSIEDFEQEESFPAGNYTLEAFYGDESSQGVVKSGDKGTEHAYYYGKTETFRVSANQTTTVLVQTSLANAVVAIEYTDAFKNYFTDWSTVLNTRGEMPIEIGNEEALCYVVPGDVDVIISATQQNGKSLRISPAIFEAEPRHLYKIRYNIYNGEIGEVDKLEIVFDEGVDGTLPITIDLTDELLQGNGPVINTEGFDPSETLELLFGSPFEGQARFNVVSAEGISHATLTIKSDSFKPTFLTNGSVDLCNLSAEQKNSLASYGVKMLGFSDTRNHLAYIDLSSMLSQLPEGLHEISLVVKDGAERVNDPVILNVSTSPVDCEIVGGKAIFGDGFADITVRYNGVVDPTQPGKNPFSFKVDGDYSAQDVIIKSINGVDLVTRAYPSKEYVYRITIPEAYRDVYNVYLYYNGSEKAFRESSFEMTYPDYSLEFDAYSSKILVRFKDVTDPAKAKILNNRVRIFVDGTETKGLIDQNSGVISFNNLKSNTSYNFKSTLKASSEVNEFATDNNVETEDEAQLPNNNFADFTSMNVNSINVGGIFEVKWTAIGRTYQIKSSIQRNVFDESSSEKGWATVNAKTYYEGAADKNTWYTEPSTFIEDGAAVLRTVGYSHTNSTSTLPVNSSSYTLINDKSIKYCTSSPARSDFNVAAGELFLGSYSFTDGNEAKTPGITFNSRPSALKFNYSLMPYNSEKGFVEIKVKDASGNVISSSREELDGTCEFDFNESTLGAPSATKTVTLPSYIFGSRAASIEVSFKSSSSSSPEIYIPQDTELNEGVWNLSNSGSQPIGISISANAYHAYAKGSVLKISNVELVY